MRRFAVTLISIFLISSDLIAGALDEAQQLFEGGKIAEARQVIDKYLDANPNSAEGKFLKGLILVEQRDTGGAIDIFTQMTKDYPELPEPYNNIAVIHAAEGDYDSARVALQSALKTHPSYSTAYENLGDIYAKLASEAYQQALDLEKKDRGQLKVKLSLIDNLFGEKLHSQQVAAVPAVEPPPVNPEPAALPVAEPVQPPVVEKPVSPPNIIATAEQEKQIAETLQAWAKAWSDKDVDAYLSHYAGNFKPQSGSLKKWKLQRSVRLKRPKYIKVVLGNVDISITGSGIAKAGLTQSYESNTYSDITKKVFDLQLVNGEWKIQREQSL